MRDLRDEVEHPLRLVRGELGDVAKRVDMPLGQDEQMRLRLRVDVPDRDEAVGLRDVVAFLDEPAEKAIVRQRGSPPGHGGGADGNELAERAVDEPRRVVGAVATAGPVDQDDVRLADLLLPAGAARLVGERAQPGAPLLLHLGRNAVVVGGPRAGRGEYGKTCSLVRRAARTVSSVRSNAASSSAGKPTITSR